MPWILLGTKDQLTTSAHVTVKSGAQEPNFLKSNPSATTYESLNPLVPRLPHL